MIKFINPGLPPIFEILAPASTAMGARRIHVDRRGQWVEPFQYAPARSTSASARLTVEGEAGATPEFVWIATRADRGGRLARLAALATVTRRLGVAGRALNRSGYTVVGQFGVYPGFDQPQLAFQLACTASSYMESHLMPEGDCSSFEGAARAILRPCLGLNPDLGGVLTIGRRGPGALVRRGGVLPEVAQFLGGVVAEEPTSIACVSQTNPTHLIFGDHPNRPLCVVQYGPRDKLKRLFANLARLHRLLPDQVPAPLHYAPLRDPWAVLVQDGLDGIPILRLLNQSRDRARRRSSGSGR